MIDGIAIFAGGKGSRLKASDCIPKPFIDVNGKPLVRRVLDQMINLSSCNKIFLLTCSSSYCAGNYVSDNFTDMNLSICEEPKMTGKIGAMNHFFERNPEIDICLFANADTLFLDEQALLAAFNQIKINVDIPHVFLANPDMARYDYSEFLLNVNGKTLPFQNSGVFVASKTWTSSSFQQANCAKDFALEHILLNNENSQFVVVYSDLLDIGTPERLEIARELIHDNY